MSTFPNEILQEIFSNINDIKTLHSIILVNRNWCRNGIKYLWKDPFRSDVDLKNHIDIVPLLLKFIVKDKEFMKRFIRENYNKIMKEFHDKKTRQEDDAKDEDKEQNNDILKNNDTDEVKEIDSDVDEYEDRELDYDDDDDDDEDDDDDDDDDDEELDFDEYDYEEDEVDYYEDYEDDYEDSDEYDLEDETDDDDDIECSLPSDASFDYPSFITYIDFHNIFLLATKYVRYKESNINNKYNEATSSDKNTLEKGKGKEIFQDEYEIGSLNLDSNIPLPDVPEIEQVFGFVFTIMRIIVKRGAIIEGMILRLDEIDLFGEHPDREPPTSIFHYSFDEKAVEQFITRLDMFFISLFAMAYEKQKMTFKKLKYVELSGCVYKTHVLASLSLLSKNVKVLWINDFNLNDLQEPLTRFIKSQNQLEQIRIKGDSLGYIIDKLSNISGVISNLETQANTLKKLKLTNAYIGNDFGFESLLKCKQLENLSLVQVNLKLRHLKIFNHASFPNLKTLKLDFIDYSDGPRMSNSINPFIRIMNNRNMVSSLDVLSIKYEGENNYKLLKNILENCNKNLTSFSTFIIEKQDIPPLFSILKKCINMKKLSLTRSCRMTNFGFTVEMAKILPKSLDTLEFIHMVLSDSSLVGFFDNCKAELKQFRLNFHGDHHLDRIVYRGLIEKYSKENRMVIKELDMSSDSAPNLEFNVMWE